MKIKIYDFFSVKWLCYMLICICYAITQKKYIMYFLLLTQIIHLIYVAKLENYTQMKVVSIETLMVSMILPDNYCIILCSFLCFYILGIRKRISVNKLVIIIFTYIIANIIFHRVRLINFIIYFFYAIPFVTIAYSLNKAFRQIIDLDNILLLNLKRIIFVECMTTVIYAISHIDIIKSYQDLDWVTGTLGPYQCNVLMCIASFGCIIFASKIRNKNNIFWCLLSCLLTVSTGSVAYLIMLFLAIVIIMATASEIKLKNKITLALLLFFGVITFMQVSPNWIVREMPKLTNITYLTNRVTKLQYYKNTFYEIPKNENIIYWLTGTGVGQYSSRAAETCAGGYIGLYDNFFNGYETHIRTQYISSKNYGGAGLASTPQSSIIAIQGELGLIGTALIFTYFCFLLYKARSPFQRVVILYFFNLMLVDNALEFAKYVSIFWLAYYMVGINICHYKTKCANTKNH